MNNIIEAIDPTEFKIFLKTLNINAGEHGHIPDENKLMSAISSVDYYTSINDKISSIIRSIVKNHAFTDGNKRTAVLFFLLMTKAAKIEILLSKDQLATVFVKIANGNYTVEEITQLLFTNPNYNQTNNPGVQEITLNENKSYIHRFTESWLFEMARSTGPSGRNPYPELALSVESIINNDISPEIFPNGLRKIVLAADEIYCWIEKNNQIDIIARLSTFKNGLAIELVGKHPNSNTYASDFYQTMLDSTNMTLLFGGHLLSDEGFDVWIRLLNAGRTIMAYDPSDTNHYRKLNTPQDLTTYIGSTVDYEQYRYVLAENSNKQAVLYSAFELLRAYKLTFNIKD